jgi:hypothetical protein
MNKLEILEKLLECIDSVVLKKELITLGFGLVETVTSPDYHTEKDQGTEGEETCIYFNPNENLYIKIITITDSYGDIEMIRTIKFVEPITKTVNVYE